MFLATKANKKTYQNDISILENHFYPVWRDVQLNQLRTQDIQRLMDSLLSTLQPASTNRMISLIHRMLKLACEWGHLEINPASTIKKFKENNLRNFFMSREQVASFLSACDAEKDQNNANFFRLALLTGMRAGDLGDLRIHDIRHTFASILINSRGTDTDGNPISVSLYDVQHLLGHHFSQTTERYAHLASDRLRSVRANVAAFVSDATLPS